MKLFMFVTLVAMIAVGMMSTASAQTTGDIAFSIDVATTPITATGGDLTVTGVAPGQTFAVVPDGAGANIELLNPAATPPTVAMTVSTIDGDPGADVLVSFALPYIMTSAGGGQGSIKLDYNGTSGVWNGGDAAMNNYFNPKADITMTLDQVGHVEFYLGALITISPSVSVTETYVSDAIFTVAYTGSGAHVATSGGGLQGSANR